jgi:hypothetical protein
VPHPGASWQPREHPAQQPHEYIRGGTTKIPTLFHPASGRVRLQPAVRGTNAVLHPWLREHLSEILAALPVPKASLDPVAARAAWAVWQAGLAMPFPLPHNLPPLRLLLVWDNLAGHKTPDLVLWLCAQGIMPLYTPVGGSWLNMAESIERVLKRRALDGQHPHSPDEIGSWFEQTARAWRAPGMSNRPRLCGTANAGRGGDDPVASRSIGSAARAPAPTNRFTATSQTEYQNARSHEN